jgi:Domain of unknown function (DUF4397)/Bacterial SH3 domain
MLRKLVSFVILFCTVMVLAGAAQGLPVVAAQLTTSTPGNVRVVNGLVGIGPVDVFLDNQQVAYSLEPEAATPYYFIPPGVHQIAVRTPGDDPLSVPIADVLVDLSSGNSLTAIAYQKDFTAPSSSSNNTVPFVQVGAFFVLSDDRSPIQLGRARLAVAHLAVGTPQRLSIGYRSGEALLYQVALESPYGTIDLDAGAQTLAIIDADSPTLAILSNFGDYSFYSSTLYTLVVVTVNTGTDADPILTPHMFIVSAPIDSPPGKSMRLRIVHAAHDTAVLDVYVDGRLIASRFNYGRFTEYLGLADYGHTITLRRFGDPATVPPLGQAIFTINTDNKDQLNWTLLLVNVTGDVTAPVDPLATNAPIVVNTPGGSVVATILPDNISATPRNYARVRVINAADGVQSIALFADAYPLLPLPEGVTPTPAPVPTEGPKPPPISLTDPVTFGAEASEREIPVGLYQQLSFVPGGGISSLDHLDNQELISGLVYTYIIMGSTAGNPPIQVVSFAEYGTGLPLERQYLGVITSPVVNVRASTSTNGQIVGTLRVNDRVTVMGRSSNSLWIRIHFTDSQTGLTGDGWLSVTVGMRITRLGTPVKPASLPVFSG